MFDILTRSRWQSRPVRLYRFTLQSLVWRFAVADRDIVVGDDTYVAIRGEAKNSAIRDTSSAKKSEVSITLPYLLDRSAPEFPVTQSLGDVWRPYVPSSPVDVEILEIQYDDPAREVRTRWTGIVVGGTFKPASMVLVCAPSAIGSRKSGLALRLSRSCPLVHYSQGRGMCNVDPAPHRVEATLSGAHGPVLYSPTFASLPDRRLAGGRASWTCSNGIVEWRSIRAHDAARAMIDVGYGGHELAPELVLDVWPGCQHNWSDCSGYYSNGDNYGGCPHMPTKDLFDGNRRV